MKIAGGLRVGLARPLFFLALIVVAVLLRAGNLGELTHMEADERQWYMVGTSLLTRGVPESWSGFIYPAGYGVARDCHSVVTPFLDSPPFFSLLIGGWATFVGEVNWCEINWSLVRAPMIAIAVLTMIFAYLLARRVFDGTVAMFVLLAFVFFPSHIVVSRVVAAESFVGLWLVMGLYLFAVFEQAKNSWVKRLAVVSMTLLCLTALLIKLWGVVVPAALTVLALSRRRWLLAALFVVGGVMSMLFYLAYGYYYSWEVMRLVLAGYHNFPQSFAHWWSFFTNLNVGHREFYDPSIIVGLIGAICLVAKRGIRGGGAYIFGPLFIFSYLFLHMAPTMAYGWYKYAMYPVIAMGLGYVFSELWRRRVVWFVLFLPLISMMLEHSGLLVDPWNRRIVVMVLYSLVGVAVLFRNSWLQIRPVFLSLLLFLFSFEVLWVGSVLGYWTWFTG